MTIWKITKYIRETTTVEAETRKEALELGSENDFDYDLLKTTCVNIDKKPKLKKKGIK